MISLKDLTFLNEAYTQAANAAGNSDPNPAVGAVITNADDKIISRGFTQRAGFAHAERHALSHLSGEDLTQCTMYVTLEPCCHHGRTPPCSDAIIQNGIRRVVIGERDFAPEVQGRSVELLRNAGIQVDLAPESDFRRERWFTTGPFFFARRKQRPRVLLKWAQTTDGKLGPVAGSSGSISGAMAAFITATLRFSAKMTLAAPGTVLSDMPRLSVRPTEPPLRLYSTGLSAYMTDFLLLQNRLAHELALPEWDQRQIRPPERMLLMPESSEAELTKIHAAQAALGGACHFLTLARSEWELDFSSAFETALAEVLSLGFNSVLVEAGPAFSEQIIAHGFADAIAVYRSRTKTAQALWGNTGRGNSVSLQLAAENGTPAIEEYAVLETANLGEDDFFLLVRSS